MVISFIIPHPLDSKRLVTIFKDASSQTIELIDINIFQQKRYKMNTFEDAFRVAIEKHMNKKNNKMESNTLHPLNLTKMIKDKNQPERVKNNTSDVSG